MSLILQLLWHRKAVVKLPPVDCKSLQPNLEAWNQIIALAEPIWKPLPEMADSKENIGHKLTASLWEQYIAPLC
jgi:hypothetical protein